MHRRVFIALGMVVFLVTLVTQMPAAVAYRWLAPDVIRLTGIDGTLWGGNARLGSIDVVGFQDLEWHLKPSRLLLGRVAADVTMKLGEGFLEGGVATGLAGRSFRADELKASLNLSNFEAMLPLEGISGILNLDLKHLVMDDGIPVEAEGMVRLGRLTLAMAGSDNLGDYQLTFEESLPEEGIAGRVKDMGTGPFEVAGSLQVGADGNFALQGTIKSRPTAPAHLQGMLQYLGDEAADGSRQFELTGSL